MKKLGFPVFQKLWRKAFDVNRTQFGITSLLKFVFGLIFVSSFSLLAQNENVEMRRRELVIAIKPVVSYGNLTGDGDTVNRTPNIGMMFGSRIYIGNPNIAVRVNLGYDRLTNITTDKGEKVFRSTATAGLLYFIGNKPNPSKSYYLSLEGGINTWFTDSYYSRHKNIQPVRILRFGKGFEDLFFEFGIETNYLDVNGVELKRYKDSNLALNAALGFRNF